MAVYGFNWIKHNIWRVLAEKVICASAENEGNVAVENESGWDRSYLYLKEDIRFGETGLLLKKNSVCRILVCDPESDLEPEESSLLQEKFFLEEPAEETIESCCYLVNLDVRTEEERQCLNRVKEIIADWNQGKYELEFWDVSIMEKIFQEHPEILSCAISYMERWEDGETFLGEEEKKILPLLERYLEKCFMEDQFSKMEQAGSVTNEKVTLQKVFVDLEAFPVSEGPDEETERFVEAVLFQGNCVNRRSERVRENRQMDRRQDYVLLGTAGQGKSTLCQYLMQIYRASYLRHVSRYGIRREVTAFLQEHEKDQKESVHCYRIPIHIVIKEYAAWMQKRIESEQAADILLYIAEQMGKKTGEVPDMDGLKILLYKMSWIFVFDGLDEVPSSSNRERLLDEIREFMEGELRRWNCDSILICTSRPQGNLEALSKKDFCHLRLAELSAERCMTYLERLVRQIGGTQAEQESAMAVLRESAGDPIVSRLMKSPLQVTIIAILVKTGGKPPRDRYNLFFTYYETMKNREKQKETLETLHDTFDWLDQIHYRLALQLQKESESRENPSAAINKARFLRLIREYLEEAEEETEETVLDRLCESFFHILTERLCFITDVSKEGEYMFSIRSMQEFLAASEIVSMRESCMLEELNRIAPSTYWRNVFLFAIGYLNKNVPVLETEVRQICSRLNGSECTLSEYSLEKVSCTGSWLALDILIEGIYKGRPRTENGYYDIFFAVKERAVTDWLQECKRLPEEKREYLKDQYVLPALKKERKNKTLWYLVTLLEEPEKVLGLLKGLGDDKKSQQEIFEFLNPFYLLWTASIEKETALLAAELLEQPEGDLKLSYENCGSILQYGNLEARPGARKKVYEKILQEGGKSGRKKNRSRVLECLPAFWGSLENILNRIKRDYKTFEVADVVAFHLKYVSYSQEEREILSDAAAWFEKEGLNVEAAFLQMLKTPDREHIRIYFSVLGTKKEEEKLCWLELHINQSCTIFYLLQKYRLEDILKMSPEEVLSCLEPDYEESCQKVSKAFEEENWKEFWAYSGILGANGSGTEDGICDYLSETQRCVDDIPHMGDEELAHLCFVAALHMGERELKPEEVLIAETVYEEYKKRTWDICWVNIWMRRIAMYLLNRKKQGELYQDKDDYRVFLPTEQNSYLFSLKGVTTDEMQNLWNSIVWSMEAIDEEHPMMRLIPAVLLASPKVEVAIPKGQYRQLLKISCQDPLKELGRMLLLLLVPDWSEEEADLLAEQILDYLKKAPQREHELFRKFSRKYDGRKSCIDRVWISLYEYLNINGAEETEEGWKNMEWICGLAYQKVTGEGSAAV